MIGVFGIQCERTLPELMSNTITGAGMFEPFPLKYATATALPSRDTCKYRTTSFCFEYKRSALPLLASSKIRDLLGPPTSTNLPSAVKSIVNGSSVISSNRHLSLPVRASNTRIAVSVSAEAIRDPSGEKTTAIGPLKSDASWKSSRFDRKSKICAGFAGCGDSKHVAVGGERRRVEVVAECSFKSHLSSGGIPDAHRAFGITGKQLTAVLGQKDLRCLRTVQFE